MPDTEATASPWQMPTPQLQWNTDGAPFSQQFDDIYFSRADGLQETGYVFLQQNHLEQRWRALDPQHPGVFVIGETGFGTGLNFFSAWRLWRSCAPESWRLHFVSVEKFPLDREQLATALRQWPELAEFSALLLEQYPARVPGMHRLCFDDGTVLQLLFGEAHEALAALHDSAAPALPNGFAIDAWFLDGFAPAKNPAMWSDALFAQIGRLSRPGSTFATFTVAGIVKRGLQAAGFRSEKLAGFGSKRQMLRGEFEAAPTASVAAMTRPARYPAIEYWACPPPPLSRQPVIVIGGGLAGTSTARALAERGWPVTLLERGPQLAGGASGNPTGVLYTKLSAQDGTLSRFALSSYLYALRFYQRHLLANPQDGARCGVLQLPGDPDQWESLRTAFAGHEDWVQFVQAAPASELAGCDIEQPALWFPQAGWLAPAAICAAAARHPLIETRLNCEVTALARSADGWQLQTSAGELRADIVVITNASDACRLEPTRGLPLKPIRGQITQLPAEWLRQRPQAVICHTGYLTPTAAGLDIGATYDLRDTELAPRAVDHRRNVEALAAALPGLVEVPAAAAAALDSIYGQLTGRVGLRCTTPDYLPLVGAVADADRLALQCADLARNARIPLHEPGAVWPGLYVNVGHGSRGLSSTPLCAELLASLICGAPRPLPRDLVQALAPARFLVRDIVRGRHKAQNAPGAQNTK
jgi:tRNA 5-methylaminomethyl-2-thiouridine biosynthesis bifunctional protein